MFDLVLGPGSGGDNQGGLGSLSGVSRIRELSLCKREFGVMILFMKPVRLISGFLRFLME